MVTRKKLKQRGKQALKKHYLLFAAVCLLAAFIHSEFSGTLTITQTRSYSASGQSDTASSFGEPSAFPTCWKMWSAGIRNGEKRSPNK